MFDASRIRVGANLEGDIEAAIDTLDGRFNYILLDRRTGKVVGQNITLEDDTWRHLVKAARMYLVP